MGVELFLGPVTGSYVNLHKPKAVAGTTKEAFSMMLLFAPGADLKPLKDAMFKAAQEKWGDKTPTVVKHPKFRNPLKDQAELVNDNGEPRPGTVAGAMFVNTSNTLKPLVLDEATNIVDDPRVTYSGAQYRVKVEVFAWEHDVGGKGITLSLLGVQKVGDGLKLGGTGNRAEVSDFQPVGDGKTASDVFGGQPDDPFADAPKTGARQAALVDDDIPF